MGSILLDLFQILPVHSIFIELSSDVFYPSPYSDMVVFSHHDVKVSVHT